MAASIKRNGSLSTLRREREREDYFFTMGKVHKRNDYKTCQNDGGCAMDGEETNDHSVIQPD
jgi:hypothetical protein